MYRYCFFEKYSARVAGKIVAFALGWDVAAWLRLLLPRMEGVKY